MPVGTLEVLLVGAQGIKDTELFGKGDPYALLYCGRTKLRTNTATDQGSKPVWNQRFTFPVDDSTSELSIKIFNANILEDDEIGSAVIPLAKVFNAGNKLPTTSFTVIRPSGRTQGEIKLSATFTPKNFEKVPGQDKSGHYGSGNPGFPAPYGPGSVPGPYGSQAYPTSGASPLMHTQSEHYPYGSQPYPAPVSHAPNLSHSQSEHYPPSSNVYPQAPYMGPTSTREGSPYSPSAPPTPGYPVGSAFQQNSQSPYPPAPYPAPYPQSSQGSSAPVYPQGPYSHQPSYPPAPGTSQSSQGVSPPQSSQGSSAPVYPQGTYSHQPSYPPSPGTPQSSQGVSPAAYPPAPYGHVVSDHYGKTSASGPPADPYGSAPPFSAGSYAPPSDPYGKPASQGDPYGKGGSDPYGKTSHSIPDTNPYGSAPPSSAGSYPPLSGNSSSQNDPYAPRSSHTDPYGKIAHSTQSADPYGRATSTAYPAPAYGSQSSYGDPMNPQSSPYPVPSSDPYKNSSQTKPYGTDPLSAVQDDSYARGGPYNDPYGKASAHGDSKYGVGAAAAGLAALGLAGAAAYEINEHKKASSKPSSGGYGPSGYPTVDAGKLGKHDSGTPQHPPYGYPPSGYPPSGYPPAGSPYSAPPSVAHSYIPAAPYHGPPVAPYTPAGYPVAHGGSLHDSSHGMYDSHGGSHHGSSHGKYEVHHGGHYSHKQSKKYKKHKGKKDKKYKHKH